MNDKLPIMLLNESAAAAARHSADIDVVELDVDIFSEPIRMRIGVRDCRAKLSDVVPIARLFSAKLVGAALKSLSSTATPVPCRKGCNSACCHHMITISVPEAFRLVEEVSMMPVEQREFIKQRCQGVAERIKKHMPEYHSLNDSENAYLASRPESWKMSYWYSKLTQPCPFLYNNICMVYEQRPIICREHIVAGSLAECRIDGDNEANRVNMPVRTAGALAQAACELEGTDQEIVVMPCVFLWHEDNMEREKHTWPAKKLVESFVKAVYSYYLESQNTERTKKAHADI